MQEIYGRTPMPKCEITILHGCSPVNLLHIFRAPFPKNTSGGLILFLTTFGGSLTNSLPQISYSICSLDLNFESEAEINKKFTQKVAIYRSSHQSALSKKMFFSLFRGIFRTQSNIYDEAFCKNSWKPLTIFARTPPS